jgi:ABC-type lipoprotein release transport system permease subunit
VKGIDPRIYLSVGALLFAATFLASWVPARRASRVDPIQALREQ